MPLENGISQNAKKNTKTRLPTNFGRIAKLFWIVPVHHTRLTVPEWADFCLIQNLEQNPNFFAFASRDQKDSYPVRCILERCGESVAPRAGGVFVQCVLAGSPAETRSLHPSSTQIQKFWNLSKMCSESCLDAFHFLQVRDMKSRPGRLDQALFSNGDEWKAGEYFELLGSEDKMWRNDVRSARFWSKQRIRVPCLFLPRRCRIVSGLPAVK